MGLGVGAEVMGVVGVSEFWPACFGFAVSIVILKEMLVAIGDI